MKKITFMIAAITLIAVTTFVSCKKESNKNVVTTTESSQHSVKRISDNSFNQAALIGVSTSSDGFLVFTTVEAYDNVLGLIGHFSEEQLNGWEDALMFTSSHTAYNDPTTYNVNPRANKNQNIEDPLLLHILDVNGTVQIENFVFKTAYDDNYVLEMVSEHLPSAYNDLIEGTFDAGVMNKFDGSYDDNQDLFELLRGGMVGNTPTGTTSFNMKQYKDKPSSEILTDAAGTQWKAECKTVYQNLPFYFRLFGEMKYSKKGGSIWWAAKTDIKLFSASSTCRFKPKGKSWQTNTVSDYRNDNKLTYTGYAKSKKLDNFTLSLDFNYKCVNPAGSWSIVHSAITK